MDTTQIKAYAPQARKDFINAVTQRAARFGIHGDGNFDPVEFKGDTAIIGSQVFTKKGGELRERLVAKVKQTGFEMFIRSSAYTWFNRFVAIRYMELHDFLHHGFRVLSNPNGSDIPEILEHATEVDLPGLDREKVLELRLAGDKDNELYRMLVIAQCNALHKAMPFLFDRIDNEAELLLPDNLLHTNSPVKRMVSQIDETLWDDVEIIGWIYQFYISEKKDEVIGKVVKSEDIPAATQLFTPNWIVKYMVENTLGRIWMATYPESSLKSKMEYYIEPAEQEPEVQAEIDATTPKELNPEELTFLDPACGSGHILVEAYDILKEIYLERGYRTRDIPRLILSKNIYGLDIDDRAAQLACFAVLMRAREDDRRLFSRDDLALNIMSIVETKGIDKDKLLDAVSKRDGGKGVCVWI
uniref:BREX-1 system adenine-specific DNA-methyltransferase PglX n=1 Tax=Desulfobacter sp. TaxID=2294 RepID=UPI001B60551A